MKRAILIILAANALLTFTITCTAAAKPEKQPNTVVIWNLVTVKATKVAGQNSNLATRTEAIEAIAVYNAVNAIKHYGTPYLYTVQNRGKASAQAAAAYAAYDVLVTYFPAQKSSLDSALQSSVSTITDGPVGDAEVIGIASATNIIRLRATDGSNPLTTYAGTANPKAGEYRPTPAKFAPGIDVEWGKVKPFILTSAKQFAPQPPPAIGSDEYKKTLAEVAEIGEVHSTKRTEDQTHIAQFYKQDAELTANEAARELATLHNTSLEETALIFVLTDMAAADARIEVFDAKYGYLFWRPVTALNADTDGSVKNYTRWMPLVSTPAHPSFPSGHSATVTAAYEVLKKFYGDADKLELHSTTAGEPARTVPSLSRAEWENGYSRIYGGIHYAFENTAAQDVGRKIANYALQNGPKALK